MLIFWCILWDFDHLTWTFRLAHNSHPKLKYTSRAKTTRKTRCQNKQTKEPRKHKKTTHTHTLPTVFSLQKSQPKILPPPSKVACRLASDRLISGTNGCRGGASGLPCATQKSLRGRSKEALRRLALGEPKTVIWGKIWMFPKIVVPPNHPFS